LFIESPYQGSSHLIAQFFSDALNRALVDAQTKLAALERENQERARAYAQQQEQAALARAQAEAERQRQGALSCNRTFIFQKLCAGTNIGQHMCAEADARRRQAENDQLAERIRQQAAHSARPAAPSGGYYGAAAAPPGVSRPPAPAGYSNRPPPPAPISSYSAPPAQVQHIY